MDTEYGESCVQKAGWNQVIIPPAHVYQVFE